MSGYLNEFPSDKVLLDKNSLVLLMNSCYNCFKLEGDISELINRYSVYGEYGEIKEEIIRQTYMESMVDKIPTI